MAKINEKSPEKSESSPVFLPRFCISVKLKPIVGLYCQQEGELPEETGNEDYTLGEIRSALAVFEKLPDSAIVNIEHYEKRFVYEGRYSYYPIPSCPMCREPLEIAQIKTKQIYCPDCLAKLSESEKTKLADLAQSEVKGTQILK